VAFLLQVHKITLVYLYPFISLFYQATPAYPSLWSKWSNYYSKDFQN